MLLDYSINEPEKSLDLGAWCISMRSIRNRVLYA